jgi:hypothetical protein
MLVFQQKAAAIYLFCKKISNPCKTLIQNTFFYNHLYLKLSFKALLESVEIYVYFCQLMLIENFTFLEK